MASHLRKNDIVQVITGDDVGKQGRVLSVDREADRVLVEGLNFIWKHMRRSTDHPKGARIKKEAPVHISNLRVVCQSCSKPAKVRLQRTAEGRKVRICAKCGKGISAEA